MNRRSRDQMLMAIAGVAATRGTCQRRQVGCVLSIDGRPVTLGYNGTPSGLPHCNHKLDEPPDTACTAAVHAEANAIVFAAKIGLKLEGTELHTTDEPCLKCAQMIVNAGVVRVVYRNQYRIADGTNLLLRAGLEVIHESGGAASR